MQRREQGHAIGVRQLGEHDLERDTRRFVEAHRVERQTIGGDRIDGRPRGSRLRVKVAAGELMKCVLDGSRERAGGKHRGHRGRPIGERDLG